MSPSTPSFPPSLNLFPQPPRPISLLFVVFTPNRPLTPLSTAFLPRARPRGTQTHRGWGSPDLQTFGRSDLQTAILLAANPFVSYYCTLFARSWRLFSRSFPLFSIVCSLFRKNTRGMGGTSALSSQRYHLRSFKTGGRTSPHCRQRRSRQASAPRRRHAAAARGSLRFPSSGAAQWPLPTMAR